MATIDQLPERPVLILGTRSLAVDIDDVIAETPGFRVVGFVENLDRDRCRERLEGRPVHWIGELGSRVDDHLAVCALATTHRSRFTDQAAALGLHFATIVHPTAQVSARAALGEGSVVGRAAIVAAHARLGRHVLLNRGAMIGHHTTLGDFVTVQPGANVAGACRIGHGVYVGMGAVVIDHLTVGDRSVIGAGAVVVRDVGARRQVAGNPARVVKREIVGL